MKQQKKTQEASKDFKKSAQKKPSKKEQQPLYPTPLQLTTSTPSKR
jgi:hypothetical protein